MSARRYVERYGLLVDLDRYLATHKPGWERLAELSRHGRRGTKKLDDVQIAELVQLYQRTSSNLSYVRTYYQDPALVSYLTRLVSTAGSVIYGTRARTWRILADFFVNTFPAAVWRARWYVVVSAALLIVPALVTGIWVAHSPDALNAIASPAAQRALVDTEFESYYESERASQFASHVFTNNIGVAITAFASGVLLCLPTVYILITNGASIGVAGGLFAAYDQQAKFWGLISPHGMLEISSVIIAGAAGLQIGWSLIAPGDRSRDLALREEGRRIVTIVLGLIPAFAVAGLIEGFVTGQPWPTWERVGIGAVVEVAFVSYLVIRGRRASQAGFTGSIGETDKLGWAQTR